MRAYDWLLHLYPASFRAEYGGEMRALFARRRRDAVGVVAPIALWLGTIGEVAGNAALVHCDLGRQDVAYTMRVLRRAPGFAVTAVLIVALGIGATTAAFSVTDFVLIRPLPFPESSSLVKLWERTRNYSRIELSPANYRDWTRSNTVFERIGMYHPMAGNMIGAGDPLHLTGAAVSADLFPTLGVQPLIGRLFVADDDRADAAATTILSYRLWQTQFGGEPDVVGREVTIDGEHYTVIGVMPREFRFPTSEAQLWVTTRFDESAYEDRGDNWLVAVGRLKRGTTIEQARAEMELHAAQSRQQYPKENENVYAAVVRFSDEVSTESRLLLLALCGAAACVLLIACANLANLLLARALGRRRELAVRTAIGAGRERMVRQLMTESLLLASIGGALGVGVAELAVPLLARLVPTTLPIATAPTVDVRVLLFAVALTLITGLAFGLAPVLRVGGEVDLGGLREGAAASGGQRERLRSLLVVAEIVASVVLLVSAGLLMRALWEVQGRDPGFRAEGVLTMAATLPVPQYGKVSTREAFYRQVIADVRALPGVVNASFVSHLPMGKMRGGIWPVSLDGRPANRAENQNAFLRYVTPGYFATLGVRVESGRDIGEVDTTDRKPYVALISDSFVRRFWPNETPASVIGRTFTFAFADRVVIGVVGDVRMRGLERESEPQVYLSSKQVADDSIVGYIPRGLVVRTAGDPASFAPAIRAAVRRADPSLPVTDVATLADVVEGDTAGRVAQLRVIAAFAIIAFMLAGIGIHGLLSFAVSQRTQEIGVRMALGASANDIVSMVLRRIALLVAAGVVPGVALAYAAGRSMQALLAGVKAADAPTLAAAVGLSVTMAIVGSIVPTLRALRVDPISALRAE
jgi:putative ABC transport system permease protein